MDYEEYLKQNPEFAARTKGEKYKIPLTPNQFTCATCHKGFDKPQKKSFGSFFMEMGLLFISLLLLFLIPPVGAILLVITICISVFRSLSISHKKVCPYCGSPFFYKNK